MRGRVCALLCVAAITGTTARVLAYPALAVTKSADPSLDPNAVASDWAQAGSMDLGWDAVHSRPASEPTKAWITTDGKALYLRFDATQREPITAVQHTNDVGQGSDDAVWVDLWPNGVNGYFYQFYATPNGTHYEYSSENTGYSPNWESQGATHNGGYTVTMRIPLDVIRNAHGGVWKAQFVRYVRATGEQQVWSYNAVQMQPDSYGSADYAHAGSITVPQLSVGFARPKPRAAIYALGEAASKTIGGSTSRVGADLSIPITPTASFYSTFHPDYSNVELDQQSIAPTVFQRYFSEVRPFFTQAASFYNQFNCNACQNIQSLYTPAIPTPAQGYAVEGKQGPIGFASFDAIGDQRNDFASAVNYTSPGTNWFSSVQHVSVSMPGFIDSTTETGVAYSDLKHFNAYMNYGDNSGTNVLVPDEGSVLRVRCWLVEPNVWILRRDAKDRGVLQPDRRIHLASRHCRIRPVHGKDLGLRQQRQSRVGRGVGIRRPVSRAVVRHRAERQPAAHRYLNEACARPPVVHRLELLAFQRPLDADLTKRRLSVYLR